MIVLKTIAHETLWGGIKLRKYSLNNHEKIGHLYSIYCREGVSNEIINSNVTGKTLNDAYESFKDEFGYGRYDYFPLTIALVDATDDLSLQVHPDDRTAKKLENKADGKRESWYFLDRPIEGRIYNGYKCNNKQEIRKNVLEGNIENTVGRLEVQKGDYVFIAPGTLHAMSKGSLVYEIEEGSDYTYRVYDFDRIGIDGKKRELHLDKAIEALHENGKSEVQRYPLDGIIEEETYITRKLETCIAYRNESKTLECFTLIKGNCLCDGVRLHPGMTAILWPGEEINNAEISLAIVAKMKV